MIYYLIFALTALLVIFGMSSYVGRQLKRKAEKETTEIKTPEQLADNFKNVANDKPFAIERIEKEVTGKRFTRKDWLHRKKMILIQKLSRRKNRK